jgi:predicted enzyme involved in methoxymalonyl-ACP biosynthesis
MARYDHLAVYQSAYDLNLYFFRLSRGFPKDFKYGLAEEIKSLLSDLLDQIVIANNSTNKCIVLKKASLTIERIKIKSRILHDLKVMSLKSYEYFFKELGEISKQLEKWYAWAKKELVIKTVADLSDQRKN